MTGHCPKCNTRRNLEVIKGPIMVWQCKICGEKIPTQLEELGSGPRPKKGSKN